MANIKNPAKSRFDICDWLLTYINVTAS